MGNKHKFSYFFKAIIGLIFICLCITDFILLQAGEPYSIEPIKVTEGSLNNY